MSTTEPSDTEKAADGAPVAIVERHWNRYEPKVMCHCGHAYVAHDYPDDKCGIKVGPSVKCWCQQFRAKR